MNYKKAKTLTANTPIVLLSIAALIYSYYNQDPEIFMFLLILAVLCGFILGILLWGLGRIIYCERYINRNVYTPGKLEMLWSFSKRIELSKNMCIDDLIKEINTFTNRWLNVVALEEEETIKFCRAAILLRYQELWVRNPTYPCSLVKTFIDAHHDEIKVLEFFRGSN